MFVVLPGGSRARLRSEGEKEGEREGGNGGRGSREWLLNRKASARADSHYMGTKCKHLVGREYAYLRLPLAAERDHAALFT